MEQIVLDTNLKFVIKALDLEEKGRLLTALLEENYENLSEKSAGIYQYILVLQQEKTAKNRKMKELSVLAAAARKRVKEAVTADLFTDDAPTVTDDVPTVIDGVPTVKKRKEAKENILNNKIKNIFISSENQKVKKEKSLPPVVFVPPKVDDVRAFVEREGLNVTPEVFVDFYDSHGWCVGKTPIKNWQATARLWHRRYVDENPPQAKDAPPKAKTEAVNVADTSSQADETYWHELNERVREREKNAGTGQGNLTSEVAIHTAGKAFAAEKKQAASTEESPFARFMRRIEDNDILPEDKQ